MFIHGTLGKKIAFMTDITEIAHVNSRNFIYIKCFWKLEQISIHFLNGRLIENSSLFFFVYVCFIANDELNCYAFSILINVREQNFRVPDFRFQVAAFWFHILKLKLQNHTFSYWIMKNSHFHRCSYYFYVSAEHGVGTSWSNKSHQRWQRSWIRNRWWTKHRCRGQNDPSWGCRRSGKFLSFLKPVEIKNFHLQNWRDRGNERSANVLSGFTMNP